MKQIVFLTYIARSGSTFLANLLDRFDDINVTLEARMPDGTKRALLGEVNADNLNDALDVLYADDKFRTWNVDRDALKRRIEGLSLPATYAQVFESVLDETFKDRPAPVCVYKCGRYIEHADRLGSLFPSAKFIFVQRDIRAVYNSQKRSISSSAGMPLADNPLAIARRFKRVCALLKRYTGAEWLCVVKYEDLVTNEEKELRRVLDFLDVPEEATPRQDAGYADKIPDAQKHLHENVGKEAKTDRVDAWKDTLRPVEIRAIQQIAGSELQRCGYQLVELETLSPGGHLAYWGYLARSFLQALRRKIS